MLNEKYSHKDFTNQSFTEISATEFNNTEIVGSCFYQENLPDSEIFPAGMTGVTFMRCNLNNVLIPSGNSIDDDGEGPCPNHRIMVQNDLRDWYVDEDLNPIAPVDDDGGNTDPAQIPAECLLVQEMLLSDYNEIFGGQTKSAKAKGMFGDTWFAEKPKIIKTETRPITAEMVSEKYQAIVDGVDSNKFTALPTLVKRIPAKDYRGHEHVIVKGEMTFVTVRGKMILWKNPRDRKAKEVQPIKIWRFK